MTVFHHCVTKHTNTFVESLIVKGPPCTARKEIISFLPYYPPQAVLCCVTTMSCYTLHLTVLQPFII
jgi:hypothetical protein